MFSKNDLRPSPKFKMPVYITVIGGKEIKYHGYLTNWSELGCFVKLNKSQKLARKKIKVFFSFEEQSFMQRGDILSTFLNNQGVGIKFHLESKPQNGYFDWKDLYNILKDYGYLPEYFC